MPNVSTMAIGLYNANAAVSLSKYLLVEHMSGSRHGKRIEQLNTALIDYRSLRSQHGWIGTHSEDELFAGHQIAFVLCGTPLPTEGRRCRPYARWRLDCS